MTIAGSDCSGGAGIQADLKTMSAHGMYGMSVITALTAQNTTGVYGIQEASPDFVAQQMDCIFTDIVPDAVKIGMVSSAALIDVIADKLEEYHAKNVVVRNCTGKGEYLAWYCENVTFERCKIVGTQPLCYCKNLKLINCEMMDTDLAFEKSQVEATVTTPVLSIKNPLSGRITVPSVGEIIRDDAEAKGEVVVTEASPENASDIACA